VGVDDLPKLKVWMEGQEGTRGWPRSKNGLPKMGNDVVTDALAGKLGPLPNAVREMLTIRQLSRDAAVAKYSAFLNHEVGGRCHNTHVYYQAGPGRFAGRGPQPQNLRRLDKGTLEDRLKLADILSDAKDVGHYRGWLIDRDGVIPTLGGMVRLAVCAKPGHVLVVRDYSAIEMRVLHWLAQDEHTLQTIRDYDNGKGGEPYKLAAASMYSKPVAEVTSDERQQGKILILGSGYMAGAATLQAFAAGYGVNLTMEQAQDMVQLYRRSYPLVKRMWYALGKAAVSVVKKGGRKTVGHVDFYLTGHTLNARLPSGRELKYYDAQVIDGAYGEEIECTDPRGGGRRVIGLPILVENIDQATSRDLLADALLKCRAEGLPVVLHVHDELVVEAPESEAEKVGDRLRDIMESPPSWAAGLPVATSGGYHKRYIK
jgi:DNA polymerase bacteriophage-type